jgi:hypothetical protein
MNNEKKIGQVLWQDPNCLGLRENESDQTTLIWLQGIMYIKLYKE